MKTSNFSFGDSIRARRRFLNLTQADLADTCGVSGAFITQLESGTRRPSVAVLTKLACALKMDVTPLARLAYPEYAALFRDTKNSTLVLCRDIEDRLL